MASITKARIPQGANPSKNAIAKVILTIVIWKFLLLEKMPLIDVEGLHAMSTRLMGRVGKAY